MANLKRLFVVVLTVAMIVTSMATAFGAPLTDLSGKKYEDAVNKLASFGIVAGDNGQFKGENKLTRAEFATFIVKMLGLGEQSKVDTVFSDATANDWYSGYVNAVTEREIMVGVGAGQFAPNKNVTYGEAITVLMKMIGYAPVVEGRGTWPNNYISRASNIELTNGVSVSGSTDVTRGNLAILMWNAMTTKKLVESGKYDKDGNPEFEVAPGVDKTLLYENFNDAVAIEDKNDLPAGVTELYYVTDVPMTSSNNDTAKISISNGGTYTMPAGMDPNVFLGRKVQFVANGDDQLLWIKDATEKENVIVDTVKEIGWTTRDAVDEEGNLIGGTQNVVNRIKFMSLDKSYNRDQNMTLVYNGVKIGTGISDVDLTRLCNAIAESTYAVGVQDPATVTAILDKNTKKIKTAIINQDISKDKIVIAEDLTTNPLVPIYADDFDYNGEGLGTANIFTGVVKEIKDGVAKGTTLPDIDIEDIASKGDLKINKVIVYKNDKVASLRDLKVNDIVRGSKIGSDWVLWIYTPKTVTVKIDSVSDITSTKNMVVTAGSDTYKFSGAAYIGLKGQSGARSKYTDTNVADISKFIGAEGTKLALLPSGKIIYIYNQVADSDPLFALVKNVEEVQVDGSTVDKFTLILPDGTTSTYNTTDKLSNAATTYPGYLIAYKLSSQNEIVDVASMGTANTPNNVFDNVGKGQFDSATSTAKAFVSNKTISLANDVANNAITANGTDYFVTASTVFLNWKIAPKTQATFDFDKDNMEVETVTWDSVKAAVDANLNLTAAAVGYNNGIAKLVVFKDADVTGGAAKYGVVVGSGLIDRATSVTINYKGKLSTYKLNNTADSVYAVKGLLVPFVTMSDNQVDISVINQANVAGVNSYVYAFSSSAQTVQYNNGGKKTLAGNWIFGKVTNVDTTERVISYKPCKNWKGTVADGDDVATAQYIKDSPTLQVYDVRDTSNVTYTTDFAKMEKDMYFGYDAANNILMIFRIDTVNKANSMFTDSY